MDFTLSTILITLWSVFGGLGFVVLAVLLHRRAAATPTAEPGMHPAPDIEVEHRRWLSSLEESVEDAPDELTDSGRHHIPDYLLDLPTYRLFPDRVARARVYGEN
ncbi:hypothetical protein [Actinoplanes sp. N902-109]|uniref:hypothetical protein n=1 Tax=Actinoplanes sp. (strain N902-109) TaxID=649831 RepID=UPI000329655B|nr:hypothetical protein [Actinoplanes sp. N902-109]AGL20817.1 hypothetical protein L083_7307 [Actinoplanes sp. N902-109]